MASSIVNRVPDGTPVWTPYGFGQEDTEHSGAHSVCVRLPWGVAYLQPRDRRRSIGCTISVYTNVKELKSWTIDIPVETPIDDIKHDIGSHAFVKRDGASVRIAHRGVELGDGRLCDANIGSQRLPLQLFCVTENGSPRSGRSLLRDIRNFLAHATTTTSSSSQTNSTP
ncbi:Ubiquitin-like domain-containing protein [Plasmodiophora brassicae]